MNISDIFTTWRNAETDGEVYGDDNWTMYGSINLFAIFESIVTVLSGSQQAVLFRMSDSYPFYGGVPGYVLLPLPNGTMAEFDLAYYVFSYAQDILCK